MTLIEYLISFICALSLGVIVVLFFLIGMMDLHIKDLNYQSLICLHQTKDKFACKNEWSQKTSKLSIRSNYWLSNQKQSLKYDKISLRVDLSFLFCRPLERIVPKMIDLINLCNRRYFESIKIPSHYKKI